MALNLSKRRIAILNQLLDSDGPLTIKELATINQVSVRTIKYDLESIREWLEEENYALYSKTNKGIWVELQEKERRDVKAKLSSVDHTVHYFEQEMRVFHIIMSLIETSDYVSAHSLADLLMVSKNTIVNDMAKVEELLTSYQLQLERRAGYGFQIKGSEFQIRMLLEYLVQRDLTNTDIYNFFKFNTFYEKSELFYFHSKFFDVYQQSLLASREVLHSLDDNNADYTLILSMAIKIAISIFRVQQNNLIGSTQTIQQPENLQFIPNYVWTLMKSLFDRWHLPLLQDEFYYIYSDVHGTFDQQDYLVLVDQLIDQVSTELQIPFQKDKQLFNNLLSHISIRLNKKQIFVNEYNPFSADIRQRYSILFKVVEKAAKSLFNHHLQFMSDSFIAYLVLHFLVSYEKLQKQSSMIRVVYVCSTGLGVTNLLQQKIAEQVQNIEIVCFASILNADELIHLYKPDLVISIFPIDELETPVVQVSPIPTPKDLSTIKEIAKKLIPENKHNELAFPHRVPQDPNHTLEETSREVIIKGYIIYEELIQLFGNRLIEEYRSSFLLHVLLMVHRTLFQQQYRDETQIGQHLQKWAQRIKEIMQKQGLEIQNGELIALMQYMKSEEK